MTWIVQIAKQTPEAISKVIKGSSTMLIMSVKFSTEEQNVNLICNSLYLWILHALIRQIITKFGAFIIYMFWTVFIYCMVTLTCLHFCHFLSVDIRLIDNHTTYFLREVIKTNRIKIILPLIICYEHKCVYNTQTFDFPFLWW